MSLTTLKGRGVVVGVIDSGWDRTRVDQRVRKGIGLVHPENDFALLHSGDDHDRIGHGTACSHLILRVAPEAEIVPIRVFRTKLETSVPILVAALDWAARQGLRLVNISLGTLREDARRPLYDACERARKNGVILVAARANGQSWSYPAVFDNVIGVEVEELKDPLGFRYRPGAAIECTANGRHPDVPWLGARTVSRAGTSLAAPIITGTVALLLERYPRAQLDDVRRLLEQYSATE